ncbi:hypothetical protein SAMN05444157_0419 [Frankineae bacterium MT45]|nr:hypothetical protein SAMN05444157_0419 [Frankineae bacterium MT45]
MRLLLDEDVPMQFVEPIRRLLPGHDVSHVVDLGWKSKKDVHLLRDARQRGFDAILTNDSSQLSSPDECRAIRDSGLHHIRYRQSTKRGLDGLAYALAGVVAAIRPIVEELALEPEQRLVLVREIAVSTRHEVTNPRTDPPAYWPRAQQKRRPRSNK